MRLRCLPLLFLANLSVAVYGTDEILQVAPPVTPEAWPLENVAIKPSTAVTWGRLENGLRYAIMPHASPPGRVSMRLLVTVGSLNENDDEQGFAHFVEHMAFAGTKHFPAGELIKFLQRQGATFGPDINADTSHTRTLYKLELPENSAATLETGLRVFRDFADGIFFGPAEVNRERGVILSEERSRHTPEEAKRLALTRLLYGGTRISERQPIGLTTLIEGADAAALRKFYDAWYRPENMCLVVVGQVDVIQVEALVRTQFASLSARAPARTMPEVGTIKPTPEPIVATHIFGESGGFDISLCKLTPRTIASTWGYQLEGLRLNSAFGMLARRLERLTQGSVQIINSSTANADVEYNRFRVLSVRVASSIDKWEKALAIAEQEVRRVFEHGFTPDELNYQQTLLRTSVETLAQSHVTTSSADLAQNIVDAMEENAPFALQGESSDITMAMIDHLTVADCQRAFRTYWGEQAPHIFITTIASRIPTAEKVRAAFAVSQTVAVAAAQPLAAAVFGYEDFGAPGAVVEKTHVDDLDLWLIRFANGVRLNLKRTAFEKGLVRFNLRVGTGSLSEPADKPGLSFWTAEWLLGGLGKHTLGELTRIVDGLESIDVRSNDDALNLLGSARTGHLPRALRELTAMIADPAFRPEGHRDMAANLRGQIDPQWDTPEGPVQRFVLPSLAGGNQRLGIPDPSALYARTAEELRAWLNPQLASGAIEIAVVGDFEVETVIAEVAKTFGTLRNREPKPALETARKLQLPQKPVYTYYYYTGPADGPTTLEFWWPVRDALTSAERLRLQMLAWILQDRVTDEVRGKKGATYSPSTFFNYSVTYPGLAFIRCKLEVKPEEANHYSYSIRDLAGKIAKKGITSDELVRAKAQQSTNIQGSKFDNNFWLANVLSDAQERPTRLTDQRTAEADAVNTTIADLDGLAHKYLEPDRVFRYIIEPSARIPKQKKGG